MSLFRTSSNAVVYIRRKANDRLPTSFSTARFNNLVCGCVVVAREFAAVCEIAIIAAVAEAGKKRKKKDNKILACAAAAAPRITTK